MMKNNVACIIKYNYEQGCIEECMGVYDIKAVTYFLIVLKLKLNRTLWV